MSTLVRFDPARPAEPADEQRADQLNEALRGKAKDRVAAFGTDRPFRVEWEVLPRAVVVTAARGPATSSVVVTNRDTRAALSAASGRSTWGRSPRACRPTASWPGRGGSSTRAATWA